MELSHFYIIETDVFFLFFQFLCWNQITHLPCSPYYIILLKKVISTYTDVFTDKKIFYSKELKVLTVKPHSKTTPKLRPSHYQDHVFTENAQYTNIAHIYILHIAHCARYRGYSAGTHLFVIVKLNRSMSVVNRDDYGATICDYIVCVIAL